MFRLSILGSSSGGNSALLETDGTRLLIDAGLSARRTQQKLEQLGTSFAELDAILLTHEHSDHTAALSGLKRGPELEVYATAGTARASRHHAPPQIQWRLFESTSCFRIGDVQVEAFPVPHDAQEPVGFILTHGHDDLLSPSRRLAWVTDLGHVPPDVRRRLEDVDVLALESNYCPDLLQQDTRRPWSLRQRISGRHGHLSNHAARDLLDALDSPRWRHVFVTHLSRDCNSPAVVGATLGSARCFPRCAFTIAEPDGNACWHDFS
ncbi:MBL fold metallo-hydrolase [Nibricoccus sp. IMCC34717]|uniref:MBL fold metallo-hydrolase n=1 Tax=Nibricoccus sp. IMCC34717 TaxID=3034021 RepID=UPI00384E1470